MFRYHGDDASVQFAGAADPNLLRARSVGTSPATLRSAKLAAISPQDLDREFVPVARTPAAVLADSDKRTRTTGATSVSPALVRNGDTMKGDWKQIKGKIREKWGDFTDDELDRVQGRREQFEGLLQKKLGIAKDEVKKQVDAFEKSCTC